MKEKFCTVSRGELIDRLIKADKDAARYRWLRECHWSESPLCAVVNPKKMVKLGADCPTTTRLDDAIDEAMNALMDGKAKCQHCGSQFDDLTEEAEFIGWHGMCVKCFLSEDNHD